MPPLENSDKSLLDSLRGRVPRIPVTLALIAANLLVFCTMMLHGAGLWHSNNAVQLAWGANFRPATEDGEWWRLGSALFLHFGLLHLALNMLALWEGGSFAERMYGPVRFAIIYAVSGLSGNLMSLALHGDHVIAGGASGAIFGTYGALLLFLWSARRELDATEFRWLFWGAAAFSAITITLGFMITGIDNAAHIGGFCGGCLAGIALRRPPTGAAMASPGQRAAAGVVLALAILGVILAIPAPHYRWHDEVQARNGIDRALGADQQISSKWLTVLREGSREGISFEELAGRIDSEVTGSYDRTFEQLSSLHLESAAPSAQSLETTRRYIRLRRDASRDLAEGLRHHDGKRIKDAMEMAGQAAREANKPADLIGDPGHVAD